MGTPPGMDEYPDPDVLQEAIDATATAYTGDARIDVEQHLRRELDSRGADPRDDWVAATATEIRSGYHVSVGRPDGSVRSEGQRRL